MSSVNFPKEVVLGYAGEKNARSIELDCSEEFTRWPGSEAKVMYVRPTERKDDAIYPGATTVDGNTVTWTPDDFAMELEGTGGYAQVFFTTTENEETIILGKSAIVRTTVLPALYVEAQDGGLTPYIPLYNRMLSAAESLEGATDLAESAAASLEDMIVTATEGNDVAATVSKVDDHYQIDFTLPRGPAFEYSDFTQEQLAALKGPKGDAGTLQNSSSTVTLTVAGWDSTTKIQTVTVQGMTSSSYVIVSPVPESIDTYSENGIRCTNQNTNQLTFECLFIPNTDVDVNVIIL